MFRNNGENYGLLAKLFHWVLALYMLGLFVFGKYLTTMKVGFATIHLFNYHKIFGLMALALILMRLAWRLYSPPPPTLTDGARPWELRLAHFTHFMLYVLMLAMPLSGWIASSASGIGISFFGLASVPLIAPPVEWVEKLFFAVHHWLATLLVIFLILHVAGALKRHFVLRDRTLRRMWF
jgi:cytochrome b561